MSLEERRPGNASTAGGCWFDKVILKDAADRASANVDVGINQGPLDPSVTPTRIVRRHTRDELLDVGVGTRSTGPAPLEKGPFFGHEFPMPAEQGGWCHDGIEIAQRFAASLPGKGGKRSTLCVREYDSTSAESGAQSAILSLQVLDPCGGLSLELAGYTRAEQGKEGSGPQGHQLMLPVGRPTALGSHPARALA